MKLGTVCQDAHDLANRQSTADILERVVGNCAVAAAAVIRGAGNGVEVVTRPTQAVEPSFIVYSITKTFIAVIALRLCELGKLSLDDSLARWFPDMANAHQIALRQVLNHTAGIPDYGGLERYHNAVREHPSRAWTFAEFAAETFEKKMLFAPGMGWMYSNPGYMLLRHIVEQTSGMTLRTAVREYISTPLHLGKTTVVESMADLHSLAPAQSSLLSVDRSARDVRKWYDPGWVAHGVVTSTASEIALFLHALFTNQLLTAESLQQMTHLHAVPAELNHDVNCIQPSYGLGLMGDPLLSWGVVYGHNGSGPGYSASVFHAPQLGGATVCALIASETLNAQDVVFRVFDALQRVPQ